MHSSISGINQAIPFCVSPHNTLAFWRVFLCKYGSSCGCREKKKAWRNWFWVHSSSSNMIRVAAHKRGSISSSPQSATPLTVLTQPTDLQRPLHSPQLFHWLSNWHLFTWLLILSVIPVRRPSFTRMCMHRSALKCPLQKQHPPLLWKS